MTQQWKYDDDRVALHAEGLTDMEIALKLGRARTTIVSWRVNAGLKPNIARRDLYEVRDKAMVELWQEGWNNTKIAEKLKISNNTVGDTLKKLGVRPNKAEYKKAINTNGYDGGIKSSKCWTCGKGYPCRCEKIRIGTIVYQKARTEHRSMFSLPVTIVEVCNDYVNEDDYPRVTAGERGVLQPQRSLLGQGLRNTNNVGYATGKGRPS